MSRTVSFDSRSDTSDRDLQNRSLVFSSIFSLPGEELVDDFTCALLKSSVLLFQGRLFVSRDHVCFYSALLSTEERTLIIPFDDIVEISKKNTAWVVPNAIEIKLKDGCEYFFGSFLSRNRCYDLLESIFKKETTTELSMNTLESSWDCSPSQSANMAHDCELPALDPITSGDDSPPDTSEQPATEASQGSENCYELSIDKFESRLSETSWGKPGLEFKDIGRIELPLSTKDVFSKLYADSGTIYSVLQHFDSLGASEVQFSEWRQEEGIMVRDGSLIMPITNPLSTTKSTRVQETCHCCYDPATRSFHLRSQSSTLDAPYGDYFVVLLAYDFTPVEGDNRRSYVNARAAVYFLKSAWAVKSFIVSGAVEGVRNAFTAWSKAIVSVCSEGEEIPSHSVHRKSVIEKAPGAKRKFGTGLLSSVSVNSLINLLSEQRYIIVGSLCIAFLAVSVSLFSLIMPAPLQSSGRSFDLCFMIPDVLSACNQKTKLSNMFIAELYSTAIMLKLQSLGSVPPDVDVALQELNEILQDFITGNKTAGNASSTLRKLHESTLRLR